MQFITFSLSLSLSLQPLSLPPLSLPRSLLKQNARRKPTPKSTNPIKTT